MYIVAGRVYRKKGHLKSRERAVKAQRCLTEW
jgi:hypothetical protein